MDNHDLTSLYIFIAFCVVIVIFFLTYFIFEMRKLSNRIKESKRARDEEREKSIEAWCVERQQQILERKKQEAPERNAQDYD